MRHLAVAVALLCTTGSVRAQDIAHGRVSDVPDETRQKVMEYLQKTFVYPQLVIWKFDFTQPYPTEGVAVCGRVNFPDSTRRYIGEQRFYAHISGGTVVAAGIVAQRQNEDPVQANASAYKIACSP